MATIQARQTNSGERHYRVLVRLKGHPTQTATFARKTDAKQWGQLTEAAIREGRYSKTRHESHRTLNDLIDRYDRDVLALRTRRRKEIPFLSRWRAELGDCTSPSCRRLGSLRSATSCGRKKQLKDASVRWPPSTGIWRF